MIFWSYSCRLQFIGRDRSLSYQKSQKRVFLIYLSIKREFLQFNKSIKRENLQLNEPIKRENFSCSAQNNVKTYVA
mgnify:FL=1